MGVEEAGGGINYVGNRSKGNPMSQEGKAFGEILDVLGEQIYLKQDMVRVRDM